MTLLSNQNKLSTSKHNVKGDGPYWYFGVFYAKLDPLTPRAIRQGWFKWQKVPSSFWHDWKTDYGRSAREKGGFSSHRAAHRLMDLHACACLPSVLNLKEDRAN